MRLPARIAEIYEMSTAGRRMPAMEGVRGFAVALVFFVHYDQLIASRLPESSAARHILHWMGIMGHSGVDLFFLLSGYLIYAVVRSGKMTVGRFLARRFQRIYPTFFFVFLGYVLLMWRVPRLSKIPPGAGPAALFLAANAALLPGIFAITPLITVAWSLSYEAFYYAVLPGLYWITRMKFWNRRARVGFFLALTCAYCVSSALYWDASFPVLALRPAQHPRLVLFVAGILVYEALSETSLRRWLGRGLEWGAALLVAGTLLTIPALRSGTPEAVRASVLFVAFFALGLCCLGRPDGMLAGAFSFTPLRWLGNMSYSYYLIHGEIVHLVRDLLLSFDGISTMVVWCALPVCFAMTWLGATVLFVGVEKPLSFAASRTFNAPSRLAKWSHAP